MHGSSMTRCSNTRPVDRHTSQLSRLYMVRLPQKTKTTPHRTVCLHHILQRMCHSTRRCMRIVRYYCMCRGHYTSCWDCSR
jgi:hypothetical protein